MKTRRKSWIWTHKSNVLRLLHGISPSRIRAIINAFLLKDHGLPSITLFMSSSWQNWNKYKLVSNSFMNTPFPGLHNAAIVCFIARKSTTPFTMKLPTKHNLMLKFSKTLQILLLSPLLLLTHLPLHPPKWYYSSLLWEYLLTPWSVRRLRQNFNDLDEKKLKLSTISQRQDFLGQTVLIC